jgi:GNAT superfamily N-acetyltransferase
VNPKTVVRFMLTLRAPEPEEAAALTDLCLRSKAVWGYDHTFMQACRIELTLTPGILTTSCAQVAERHGYTVGFAQITWTGEVANLAKLFVEPTDLRSEVGRTLLQWAIAAARATGAKTMMIEADPCAAGFYRRMEATEVGVVASGSIGGRLLPMLSLKL